MIEERLEYPRIVVIDPTTSAETATATSAADENVRGASTRKVTIVATPLGDPSRARNRHERRAEASRARRSR